MAVFVLLAIAIASGLAIELYRDNKSGIHKFLNNMVTGVGNDVRNQLRPR